MHTRIMAILKKEFRHILRDPRTLVIVFAMPVLMVLLFGYALNMDINHIRIGVIDYDRTAASRALLRAFSSSEYFDIIYRTDNRDDIESQLMSNKIKAALVIPKGFGEDRKSKPQSAIQIIVDGSDPTFGNASINYSAAIAFDHSLDSANVESLLPLEIRERFLFNPDLKGANFIIPGIVAVILMMVCALLTSITIAREKETGTLSVLLVSPVRPAEIVIGKVMPYIALAILDAIFILVFARTVFHIPLRGDLTLLFALSVLYVYSALGMGLFISSAAPSQQVAMMAALVGTLLPSIILSGFIFSIFSMPKPIQVLSYIVPARHYMSIIRGILLKANTADLMLHQIAMLFIIGTFFLGLAAIKFKTRVK